MVLYGVVFALLFVELFWVLNFLSGDYYVMSIVLAIFFHLGMMSVLWWLHKKVTTPVLRRFILTEGVAVSVMLAFASWR